MKNKTIEEIKEEFMQRFAHPYDFDEDDCWQWVEQQIKWIEQQIKEAEERTKQTLINDIKGVLEGYPHLHLKTYYDDIERRLEQLKN